jgi:hypothetical protein
MNTNDKKIFSCDNYTYTDDGHVLSAFAIVQIHALDSDDYVKELLLEKFPNHNPEGWIITPVTDSNSQLIYWTEDVKRIEDN